MTSSADFKITGSVSGLSLQAAGGHDAVPGETLTLQLEASPGLDITTCTFSCVALTEGTAALTIPTSGVPSPVLAALGPITLPSSGLHTFVLQALVNGGGREVNGIATPVAEWVKQRTVVIRGLGSSLAGVDYRGLGKVVAGETTQYGEAWSGRINEAIALLAGGPWTAGARRRVATPDATPVDAITVAMAQGTTIVSDLWAWGKRSNGNHGIYHRTYIHHRVGAGPVEVATDPVWVSEADAAWNAEIAISTNDLVARLTGPAAAVTWDVSWRYAVLLNPV